MGGKSEVFMGIKYEKRITVDEQQRCSVEVVIVVVVDEVWGDVPQE